MRWASRLRKRLALYQNNFGSIVASGEAFLLRLIASGAADQSLSNATTYNPSNSDFVKDGSVTTDITGSASIASGELVLNNAGLYGESRTRTPGRLFVVEFTVPTGGTNYFGHHSALAVSTSIEGFRISGTALQSAVQGVFQTIGIVTVGQTYTLYIIADSTGFLGFIEGGTEYTTPELVFVDGSATGNIVENVNETAAVNSSYLTLKTPDTLFTEQITPIIYDDFTGSAASVIGRTPDTEDVGTVYGNTFTPYSAAETDGSGNLVGAATDTGACNIDTGKTDFIILDNKTTHNADTSALAHYVVAKTISATATTLNTDTLYWRYQGGGLGYAIFQNGTRVAGNSLIGDLGSGGTFDFMTVLDGATISVYVDGVFKINYGSISAPLQAATEYGTVQLSQSTSSINKVHSTKVYKKTGYTFDV